MNVTTVVFGGESIIRREVRLALGHRFITVDGEDWCLDCGRYTGARCDPERVRCDRCNVHPAVIDTVVDGERVIACGACLPMRRGKGKP